MGKLLQNEILSRATAKTERINWARSEKRAQL